MWAGPETDPQIRSDEFMWFIVKLANGLVTVLGTDRSTTTWERR